MCLVLYIVIFYLYKNNSYFIGNVIECILFFYLYNKKYSDYTYRSS